MELNTASFVNHLSLYWYHDYQIVQCIFQMQEKTASCQRARLKRNLPKMRALLFRLKSSTSPFAIVTSSDAPPYLNNLFTSFDFLQLCAHPQRFTSELAHRSSQKTLEEAGTRKKHIFNPTEYNETISRLVNQSIFNICSKPSRRTILVFYLFLYFLN